MFAYYEEVLYAILLKLEQLPRIWTVNANVWEIC